MTYPQWITRAGDLGVIPENEFYLKTLEASSNAPGPAEFFFISGELPPGLQIGRTGTIQGVPIVVSGSAQGARTYSFSVRARNSLGRVSDRTFSITISDFVLPTIIPDDYNIGDFFDGSYFSLQLLTLSVPREGNLQWTLESGQLPDGVSLSSTGLISGFILPIPAEGPAGLVGYDRTRFDQFAFDSNGQYRRNTYVFTVKVFDGANYDTMTYRMYVATRPNWTADNDIDLVVSDFLTIDWDNRYVPIVLTPPQELPTIRSDNYFAFRFTAIDPEFQEIRFSAITGAGTAYDANGFDGSSYSFDGGQLPPGLTLDPVTGWLSGYIPPQSELAKNYTFEIVAYRKDEPEYISDSVRYTITVLTNLIGAITWQTPSDLGEITNGTISEFRVSAVTTLGRDIKYRVVESVSRLPQGLRLQDNGFIVGRASFQFFSLDAGITTIDKDTTVFDTVYSVTIEAYTDDDTIDRGIWLAGYTYVLNDVVRFNNIRYVCIQGHTSSIYGPESAIDGPNWAIYQNASSTRTFTIKLNTFNKTPFENLYIQALPSRDQRELFEAILSNQDIFPEELIYRPTDPWFGKANSIRSLFMAGLDPSSMSKYAAALEKNHFTKSIEFGNVKTARAVDEQFRTKYEVVYLELLDPLTNNGRGSDQVIDKTGSINPFYDPTGQAHTIIYPNSFSNMTAQVTKDIGFSHPGSFPDWMTSTQENTKTLGFVNAVVLAYTVPGAAKLIAYRLKTHGLAFNDIEFKVDRYTLDNYLTDNYNIATQKFYTDPETTFDRIRTIENIEHSVDYAVRNMPFDNINGQTVEFINARGGLDGVTSFREGDTLIFAQQENFAPNADNPFMVVNPNNGWNEILPGGSTQRIPGYIDNLLDPAVPNKRAGIWRIRIETPPEAFVPNQASDFGNEVLGFDTKPYDYLVEWDQVPLMPNQIVWLDFVGDYNYIPFWISGFQYSAGSHVTYGEDVYLCEEGHLSSVFSQDLSSEKWSLVPSVKPNDLVQINNGISGSQLILIYNTSLKPGNSVPEFTIYNAELVSSAEQTKFDGNNTRFFSFRDYYAEPGITDKYLKFPKTGVFY